MAEPSPFIAFFAENRIFFMTAHLLGVALGLGGATITDTLFFKFLKDFRISQKEAEVMQTLSNIILGALVVIFVAGIGLYIPATEKYDHSPAFLFKMFVTVVLTINGFVMHWYVSPKLIDLSFRGEAQPIGSYRKLRRLAFALGAISATSWYSAFLTAMLKTLLPPSIGFFQLFFGYLAIVCVAIIVSECFEAVFTHQSRKRGELPPI